MRVPRMTFSANKQEHKKDKKKPNNECGPQWVLSPECHVRRYPPCKETISLYDARSSAQLGSWP
jgi:hypothetical protein